MRRLRQLDQAQDALARLQHLEQAADALEVGQVGDVLEQLGVAAHDQKAALAPVRIAAPGGEAGRDHLLRQRVELAAVLLDLVAGCLRAPRRSCGPASRAVR